MRQSIGLSVLVCAVLVAVAVRASVSAQTPPPQQGRGGAAPTNLQVLPKDMPQQQVVAIMRTFTQGLGVMCDHCHVGTQADRAKDDKPEKATARKMIKMMMAINDDFLKDVGTAPEPGKTKVTCYTCHRGAVKPLTVPPAGGGF
jgi:Photosynthetic reaction centre cytochrome C subunit